uniref:Virion structural protein n=1 Tax=Pantoea phage Survivor TaxID=3232176 RepID=A0AAU8KZC3_9CAUD
MSNLKLQHNGMNYSMKAYGGLGNLRRIMARNDDSFESWLNLGGRTVQNQNPLVGLLQVFSVNVEWTTDYLINVIDTNAQSLASLMSMTCLYNKGKDHPLSVYPESNHRTLLVVPFGKPDRVQINSYFSSDLNNLVPFYPIYTTDTKQRWDLTELMDTQDRKAETPIHTIIQIDIYALVIGFYRWLKSGREYGNSPHGYIANFPLMNCYLYHNELVNFNYLNSRENSIYISKGEFALEPYAGNLKDYTDHKNRAMLTEPMKSYTEFIQINQPVNIAVDQYKMIFPDTYKSLMFMQLSWVWTFPALGMAEKYLAYNKAIGTVDGVFMAALRDYYKESFQAQVNQIKDQNWATKFTQLHNDVKTFI